MPENTNVNSAHKEAIHATLQREIERMRRLREDVVLLRFHLSRRTDLAKIIDPGDRLSSEAALKSSLEILENVEQEKMPPVGHIAAASSALLDTVDRLVSAARMAQEQDGTGEEPLPITPESLRASLPKSDVAYALGTPLPQSTPRETATEARDFLISKCRWTVFWFIIAICVHSISMLWVQASIKLFNDQAKSLMNFLMPLSGFFWALVGSFVWILIRFRRFGAAYAFDPAQANIFKARIFSGSITTAVLLYFVFGGEKPWAGNWEVNLPLWGFVLGYAGKLQVELLSKMVERVQTALSDAVGKKSRIAQIGRTDKSASAETKTTTESVGVVREPETKAPEISIAGENEKKKEPKEGVSHD